MISHSQFLKAVGVPPTKDDLERVNCPEIGEPGHHWCGWCYRHNRPRFLCGAECAVYTIHNYIS